MAITALMTSGCGLLLEGAPRPLEAADSGSQTHSDGTLDAGTAFDATKPDTAVDSEDATMRPGDSGIDTGTRTADAGAGDANAADAGAADAGAGDANAADAGTADAGSSDAGSGALCKSEDCDGDDTKEDLWSDPAHCGACNNLCRLDETCCNGECVVTATCRWIC